MVPKISSTTKKQPAMKDPLKTMGASWVWPAAHSTEPNQFVEFRHEFLNIEGTKSAVLFISADSNYAVWLNGVFVNTGQYHDYPDDKTYDALDIGSLLVPGWNSLCMLVYHQGADSFQYLPGPAGLAYALQTGSSAVVSGAETSYRKSPSYTSGGMPRITGQLGFTFECDGKGEGWLTPGYRPGSGWSKCQTADITDLVKRNASRPRPIHKLTIGDRLPATVCAHGAFIRKQDERKTIAQLLQTDFLSPHGGRGVPGLPLPSDPGIVVSASELPKDGGEYIVVDLGREEAGILELELESTAGTIVDIAWGEHLDDLRVRAFVGGRNFAGRYICKEGKQTFTHYFTRLAGRYIALHVSGVGEKFTLHYAGLKPTEYPLEVKGSFKSPDELQGMIYDTAVRTLHLCMHEHYEDCPWREQALYGMDARNQAISGYYCFGEYDFPAASFALLGKSIKDDGYLEMCAPAKIAITIPSFSMAWVMECGDHYLFSGDRDVAKEAFPSVAKIMGSCIKNMVGDLLPCPTGERFWHFYDWAPGLDGGARVPEGKARFDAPLNLFYCLALHSAEMLAEACGEHTQATEYRYAAERIKGVFHKKFWDAKADNYQSYIGDEAWEHHAELTQSLAILCGACPPDVARELRKKLASDGNGMIETTLSQSIYKFDALLQEPTQFGKWVFGKIAKDWGHMLRAGATSFWETIEGGDAFGNAGSLCHGWSGTPVYFYQAYLLGVRPVSPGFAEFVVDPVPGVVESASGVVPTPHGGIKLSWEMVGGTLKPKLEHPSGTTVVAKG